MSASSSFLRSLASHGELRSLLEEQGNSAVLAQLDRWAQAEEPAAEAPAPAAPEVSAPPDAALLNAALSYAVTAAGAESRAVIEGSDVITLGGQRRLRLRDRPRAQAIQAAADRGTLTPRLAALRPDDDRLRAEARPDTGLDADLASAWLREFLRGGSLGSKVADARQLRAVSAAAGALSVCRDLAPGFPSLSDLQRRLDVAELRQPLELLVGRRPGAPDEDRFAGRSAELRQLRSFVDVLASESGLEALSRTIVRAKQSFGQRFSGERALGLELVAAGGLGKSTLVAKFALDHLQKASDAFPFVYLDFDQASLLPREPNQLLAEVARQVALTFPDHDGPLQEIRQRLAAGASPRPAASRAGPESDPVSDLQRLLPLIAKQSGLRTMLLVLDSFEAIQSDPRAVEGVQHFVRRLCERPFRALRIVASGRAEITELDGIPGLEMMREPLALGPLDVAGARAMADCLGRDLLGPEWSPEWAEVLAGSSRDPAVRREPLTIRVCVEWLRDTDPFERHRLVNDIREQGRVAGPTFVGRLYANRVIGYIRDPDARKVAWPGLVARRITLKVLREVIVPHTDLDPGRSEAAFWRLEREGWVVRREGDCLVHRGDLRERTLPFMYRFNPDLFRRLTLALRDHYRTAGDAVEASYYRLLSGEHPEFLRELPEGDLDRLGPAARDFAADWSAAEIPHARLVHAYLRSRSAPLMEPDEFARLPVDLALAHLCRAGTGRFDIEESQVDPHLARLERGPLLVVRPGKATRIARQSLLIKMGRWSALDGYDLADPDEPPDAVLLALFAARAAGSERLDEGTATRWAVRLIDRFPIQSDKEAWRIRALLLPFLREASPQLFEFCDADLAKGLPDRLSPSRASAAILRSAMPAAGQAFAALARGWKQQPRSLPELQPTLSSEEAAILADLIRAASADDPASEAFWDQAEYSEILAIQLFLEDPERQRLATGTAALILERLARGLLPDPDRAANPALRAFFAARQEDWIVPVGYAVQAELDPEGTGAPRSPSFAPISSWSGRGRGNAWWGSADPDRPADGIGLAREADEASNLKGLLDAMFLVKAVPDNIQILQGDLGRWQARLARLISRS